jgi:ribonuclease HII
MSNTYLIGIDEVGRGPLAGPVTVGVFCILEKDISLIESLHPKDSKILSEKKREKIAQDLQDLQKQGLCKFVCISVSATDIDARGIVSCITFALNRGLEKLNISPDQTHVYLDGGLRAPNDYKNQETIIKGDQKIPVISCASIVAKVYRDGLMVEHAKTYPVYEFEKHKGYGTKAHCEAIKKHGVCPLHRLSFCRNIG